MPECQVLNLEGCPRLEDCQEAAEYRNELSHDAIALMLMGLLGPIRVWRVVERGSDGKDDLRSTNHHCPGNMPSATIKGRWSFRDNQSVTQNMAEVHVFRR